MSRCMLPEPRSKAFLPESRIESNVSMSPTAIATVMTVVTVEKSLLDMLRRIMVQSVMAMCTSLS